VRRRLDVEMVRRGLAATRSEANVAINGGRVIVAGRPATKAGTMVAPEEAVVLTGPARRFVSRGGEKLDAALERFGLDVRGRHGLDAGASTGGFTDCLLRRGAAAVVAVDVGYGQLDWSLRRDPRVTVMERTNIRSLEPEQLPFTPEVVVADLSFISLEVVLPSLIGVSAPDGRFVLLTKPQFEASREAVGRGGVVRDPEVWRSVLTRVIGSCTTAGLRVTGLMASPLLGPAGNAEFLLAAERGGLEADASPPADLIDAAVQEALRLAAGGR
jgi:23S rRNA (cytidine1920-2'-O)/16S rRNA (cytidine1409-2'-O)-methyltransferase